MKKILLSLVVTLSVCSGFAQRHVNLQPYGSFVRNVNPDFRGNGYGGGLRLETYKEESFLSSTFGVHYTAPMTHGEPAEATALNSSTEPGSVSATANYTVTNYRLEFGQRLYFIGEANEYKGINFYAGGTVELWYFTNKLTYTDYDKELYKPVTFYTEDSDVNPDGSEKFGLNLALGLNTGIEKNIGPGNIFLQTAFSFPVVSGSQDGSDIPWFSPIPLNVNLGYKIPFGNKAK